MLRIFARQNGQFVVAETPPAADPNAVLWLDLLNPTTEEDRLVEQRLGISIPTKGEMEEIELSARLYNEDGAEFMTITAVANLDADDAVKTPVTFVLKAASLVTIRYADIKPFAMMAARVSKQGPANATAQQVMLGVIELMIDRMADALERVANEVDAISHEVFRRKARKVSTQTHELQSVIERIGTKVDLLSTIGESLTSITRLLAYHTAVDDNGKANREAKQKVKILQRDLLALGEHVTRLSNKSNFLLDATLGLINVQQNQIIKIFSVAAVVFLPPTLVASIYGMNFDVMPELKWLLGYPWAVGLMVLSAILPYAYFKRRGWL